MTDSPSPRPCPLPDGGASQSTIRRVLVADDSPMQRRILAGPLTRAGYQVAEADTGEAALAIMRQGGIDLIISDWMMPGMTGPEFCRAVRTEPSEAYVYFILLTSKSGAEDIAHGLDAGADDFLTKPVSWGELRARIAAGERILSMQRELVAQNRTVNAQLAEIRTLYDALERDLDAARLLQHSLLPEADHDLGAARVSVLLRSSGHVGGDLVGHYPIDAGRIGLFALDVAGHGVASAMITARVAGLFSAAAPDQNIALTKLGPGRFAPHPLDEAVVRLNRVLLRELAEDRYVTLWLGEFDLDTGRLTYVQAGHPHPLLIRGKGPMRFVGSGGLPVGLLADAAWQTETIALAPGDRLLVHSDGVTECPGPGGGLLGDPGLERLIGEHRDLDGPELLSTLLWELADHAGGADFPDDVSALLLSYRGA
ncbi:MAG TPA: fused response regulator/phosphatase [Rhodobacteraceae bacterium]|nr:fused response regulator/phosphatase [Paracoccaceae bacterium]HBG99209.1 fused response regulator/phosphatase [Paracoccaceae bacterium]